MRRADLLIKAMDTLQASRPRRLLDRAMGLGRGLTGPQIHQGARHKFQRGRLVVRC